jgi:hypothetical protein
MIFLFMMTSCLFTMQVSAVFSPLGLAVYQDPFIYVRALYILFVMKLLHKNLDGEYAYVTELFVNRFRDMPVRKHVSVSPTIPLEF